MAKITDTNRKPPKYESILSLLTRKTGAEMDEMMKALKAKDTHVVQNTLTSVKQAGYECERRVIGKGDDAVARWFAKLATAKSRTPVKSKSNAKPAHKRLKS